MKRFASVIVATMFIMSGLSTTARAAFYQGDTLNFGADSWLMEKTGTTYVSSNLSMRIGTIDYVSVSYNADWVEDPATGEYHPSPDHGRIYMFYSGKMLAPTAPTPMNGQDLDINFGGIDLEMGSYFSIYDPNTGKGWVDSNALVAVPTKLWSGGGAYFNGNFDLTSTIFGWLNEYEVLNNPVNTFNANVTASIEWHEGVVAPESFHVEVALPEPASLSFIAIGAVSLFFRRR